MAVDFDFDMDALEREIDEELPDRLEFEDGVYVRLGDGDMKAYLYLTSRPDPYTKDEVYSYLESMGVFDGYHSSNISAMVKKKVYNREIVVAEGRPAKQGVDGYYEYFFDTETHSAPKIREDGSVDYSSMNVLANVKKGDMLARYHRAISGEDGYTVRGDILKGSQGRELPALIGKGIATDEKDPDTYYSTMDGRAELQKNRLDIQAIYEIFRDVDNTIGKLEFNGDIVVHGNVGTGVVIRAGRNVSVTGTVEAAKIVAGGDVILQRGIQGNGRGQIAAKGSVMADFIESTEVDAQQSVHANSILNSFVKTNGSISVDGKWGSIIGGEVFGMESITASNIGNEVEVRTIVHAGYDSTTEEELDEASVAEKEIQQELSGLVDEMKEVLRKKRSQGERVAEWANKQITVLNTRKDNLVEKLDQNKERQRMLRDMIHAGRVASITVNGHIYRGVLLELCSLRTTIRKNDSFKRYYLEGGAIVSTVVVY